MTSGANNQSPNRLTYVPYVIDQNHVDVFIFAAYSYLYFTPSHNQRNACAARLGLTTEICDRFP